MRSPLKEPTSLAKSIRTIKDLVPRGAYVNSVLLYGGESELKIASDHRIVVAHTDNYLVYEFWKSIIEDPQIVATIAEYHHPFEHPEVFMLHQRDWPWYTDSNLRAALFFLLNRCSSLNLASAGKLELEKVNPNFIARLNNFRLDKAAFNVRWHKVENFSQLLEKVADDTARRKNGYLYVPLRKFVHDQFDSSSDVGYEMTVVKHMNTCAYLKNRKDIRWMVAYKANNQVLKMYEGANIKMIDSYGQPTNSRDACEELIIANF
jgi:hypothetical protein